MNRCSYLAYVVSVILIQVEWLAWMGGGWKRRAMWDMYENVLGTKGPSAGWVYTEPLTLHTDSHLRHVR
jgi:hypothetical protein